MRYLVNGIEKTREELIEEIVKEVEDKGLADQLGNVLPHYSVRDNARHHVVRIAREMGYLIETIR